MERNKANFVSLSSSQAVIPVKNVKIILMEARGTWIRDTKTTKHRFMIDDSCYLYAVYGR
jgi:hypothetical protein